MDGRESSGAKRAHLPTGSTPSKPQRKRVRNQSSSVQKPLFTDHSTGSTTDSDFKSPNRKVSSTYGYAPCFEKLVIIFNDM